MRSLASAMLEFRPRSREGGARVARVRRSPRLRPAGRSTRDFGSSRQRRCNPYKYLRNSGEFFSGLPRSEEHTSELQSRPHLVCRLLLEKKKEQHKRMLMPTSRDSDFDTNPPSDRGTQKETFSPLRPAP